MWTTIVSSLLGSFAPKLAEIYIEKKRLENEVRLEVLRGIIVPKSHRKTSAFMDVMVNVPSSNSLWAAAAEMAWKLDRKGIVIPGTRVLTAASALRLGAAVMTSDAHFGRIEGLRVIAPPDDWFSV